jgi:hypothetical protein
MPRFMCSGHAHSPKPANIATRTLRSKQMSINAENHARLRADKGMSIALFITGVTCAILVVAVIATLGVLGPLLDAGILVVFAALVFIGLWLITQ